MTVNTMVPKREEGDEIEVERTALVNISFNEIKNDVEFIFNDSIVGLTETAEDIKVAFKHHPERLFHLVHWE